MPHTARLFAAALLGFWLLGLAWVWQHPHRRAALEPTELEYRIDINAAEPATLELLPGVGPGIAERIDAYRPENPPFRAPSDLEAVHYIGPRTAERIAPWVRFAPE